MTSSDFDAAKAEAFASSMLGTLNESFTARPRVGEDSSGGEDGGPLRCAPR